MNSIYLIQVNEETGEYYSPSEWNTIGYAYSVEKAKELFEQWASEYEYIEICNEVCIIEVTEGLGYEAYKGKISAQIFGKRTSKGLKFKLSKWIEEN